MVGLNPSGSGPRLSPCTHQSEMTSSSKISPTVAFKDSDTTETVATNANPIIKADAAVAVLSGLRPAFDRAILLGTPNREVGVPRSFVTGSAKYGLSKFMPKKQFNAAAPRIPRSIEVLKSAVSAKTRSKSPTERNENFPAKTWIRLRPKYSNIPVNNPNSNIKSQLSTTNPRTNVAIPDTVKAEP